MIKSNLTKKYKLINRCNFCGEKQKIVLFTLGVQRLIRCANCKLIYLDKQRIDIENLYNKNYYKNSKNNSVANYCNYASQEKVIKNKFKFAYSYIFKNSEGNNKLLEIGSGYGFFLKYLPRGLKFYAVEISKIASKEIIENNPGANVYNVDFINLEISHNFNFITSFDVIEHQINLKKFLIKVHSLLGKEGVFIFTTPDYGALSNKIFGVHAPTIQPLYHNYYLDQDWIRKNLPKLGFKVMYLKTTHFEPMNIGTILLYLTFAVPVFKKINLLKMAKFLKIESVIIPFFRFGGLECIAKKANS